MSLNNTVSAERPHIAFFGRRNAGKSSVVNAVTNQRISVVSDTLGTTTDPVSKAMELLPLGPVVIIDTPGFDDEGALGELRVERTREVLRKTDIAVLIVDGTEGLSKADEALLSELAERKLPHLIAYNKMDLLTELTKINDNELFISAKTGEGIGDIRPCRRGRYGHTRHTHRRLRSQGQDHPASAAGAQRAARSPLHGGMLSGYRAARSFI